MMMTLIPETVWSARHAAATLTFAPLSMFSGLSPTATQAGPASATTSNSGSATEKWYAEIEKKVRPGVTRQQAAVMVAKENETLRQAYVEEYRQQAAAR